MLFLSLPPRVVDDHQGRVRMASEMGWGGIPLMRPSSLATRYQLYERDIIPERRIEPGQRYRARKNLVEHVSRTVLTEL